MKIAGVLAGLAVTALVVYFVFLRPKSAGAPVGKTPFSGGSVDSTTPPKPGRPMESPLSRQEEIRQEFSQKRLPYYKFLKDNFSDIIEHFGVTESIDTLDVQVAKDDDAIMKRVISEAVGPSASQYGFRRVRFYVANPRTSVTPVTLIAESALDDAGNWNTFKK